MKSSDDYDKKLWDRRRKNLRILIAAENTDPTNIARECNLSPNTLTKFFSGASESLSTRTLDRLLPALGKSNINQLDTDNPLHDPYGELLKIIQDLSISDQYNLLDEVQKRYANDEPAK